MLALEQSKRLAGWLCEEVMQYVVSRSSTLRLLLLADLLAGAEKLVNFSPAKLNKCAM